MFRSISWRTAISFGLLIVLCTVGFSTYVVHFLHNSYLDNLRTQLADQARIIGDSSITLLSSGEIKEIDTLSKQLGNQIDARVTIISKDGTVLGDSKEELSSMENHLNRPEVQSALSEGLGSDIRYSETLGYEMMYVAVPAVLDDGTEIVARASLPLTEINESLNHINRTIILVALVATVITVLLAFQISRIITNPVKNLTQMAQKMAGGELNQKIQVKSNDEVGALTRAFNIMSARIKETVAVITAERDKMAVILSNMGDGILVVDANSRLVLINKAAEHMLGITADQVRGSSYVEAVRDYEMNELLKNCLVTRKQQKGKVEINPGKHFLRIIATPLEENSGCLLLLQDFTELRRLETIRSDFVSNISHELRTPVASIKALAETLKNGAVDDPAVSGNFLGKIEIEIDRLAQMIQELGDLSRIESGESLMAMDAFEVNKVIKQAITRLQALADRNGVVLDTIVQAALPLAYGDKDRIEQVLVNLIHNAIKFTPPKGKVNVSAESDVDKIVVSVKDNGAGINPDDLHRIFERFYKADRARTKGGTGLGLAIAKHIIEAHGGKIWAESTAGKGSLFRFTLQKQSHLQ